MSSYAYTSMGTLWRTALSVNGDDTIDLGGSDRISETTTSFVQVGSDWYLVTDSGIYPDGSSTVKTIQTKEVRLTFPSTGNLRAEVHTVDTNGNDTVQTTSVDRTAKVTTVSTTVPRSNVTAQQITYNGMLVESRSTHNVTTKWDYDALGRVSKTIDPRRQATVTHYYSQTLLPSDTGFEGSDLIATYYYDAAGRVSAVTDGGGYTTYMAYNSRGQLEKRWGAGTQPVSYVYDGYGRLQEQYTYRGGTGWDGSSWSSDVGTGDLAPSKTTFHYHDYGLADLLAWKEDPAGRKTYFDYDALGRTTSRYVPRGANDWRETAFVYSGTTGELTNVNYRAGSFNASTLTLAGSADTGTPSVTYSYKRTGALDTVIDAAGTRTFNYNTDLQVDRESLPAIYGGARSLKYIYASSGVVGRLTGMQVTQVTAFPPFTQQLQTVGYTYKADGRLEQVSGNGSGLSSYAFSYGYTANSDYLIASLTSSQTAVAQSRTYNDRWDVAESFATTYPVSGSPVDVARYDYTYNIRGLRATAMQSGNAYADYALSGSVTPTYYRYAYNGRGELTTARAYLGDTPTSTAHPLAGRQFQFDYDNAGNRAAANRNDVSALLERFTSDVANQVTSRENHALAVQGTVHEDAKVLVTSNVGSEPIRSLAGRAGTYFGGEAVVNNLNGPTYQTASVTAAVLGTPDVITQTNTPAAYVAKDPETMTYDHAGNLTEDGQWSYTWDAENRLIAVETNAAALATGVTPVRLTMRYDYLGRRIEKKRFGRTGGTWDTTASKTTCYLYNGWNVIAELDGSGNFQRHLFWGLDLSGSATGMGGIGALLFLQDNDSGTWTTYVPGYDGSGNVAVMLKANDGTKAAIYEYGPYGELLRAEGSFADKNPFRAATKYTDETGLVYYGYRYYSTGLGRFINRDPIAEAGGLNLYAFVGNSPVNTWDILGMVTPELFVRMAPFTVTSTTVKSTKIFGKAKTVEIESAFAPEISGSVGGVPGKDAVDPKNGERGPDAPAAPNKAEKLDCAAIAKELERLKASGQLGKSDYYQNADVAAAAAMTANGNLKSAPEFGGGLTQFPQGVAYGVDVATRPGGRDMTISPNDPLTWGISSGRATLANGQFVGAWHQHFPELGASAAGNYSVGDFRWAVGNSMPLYLGAPNGDFLRLDGQVWRSLSMEDRTRIFGEIYEHGRTPMSGNLPDKVINDLIAAGVAQKCPGLVK